MLADARRGTLPDSRAGRARRSATPAPSGCATSSTTAARPVDARDYRNIGPVLLLPEFGEDTPLEKITTDADRRCRERLLDEGALRAARCRRCSCCFTGS